MQFFIYAILLIALIVLARRFGIGFSGPSEDRKKQMYEEKKKRDDEYEQYRQSQQQPWEPTPSSHSADEDAGYVRQRTEEYVQANEGGLSEAAAYDRQRSDEFGQTMDWGPNDVVARVTLESDYYNAVDAALFAAADYERQRYDEVSQGQGQYSAYQASDWGQRQQQEYEQLYRLNADLLANDRDNEARRREDELAAARERRQGALDADLREAEGYDRERRDRYEADRNVSSYQPEPYQPEPYRPEPYQAPEPNYNDYRSDY